MYSELISDLPAAVIAYVFVKKKTWKETDKRLVVSSLAMFFVFAFYSITALTNYLGITGFSTVLREAVYAILFAFSAGAFTYTVFKMKNMGWVYHTVAVPVLYVLLGEQRALSGLDDMHELRHAFCVTLPRLSG